VHLDIVPNPSQFPFSGNKHGTPFFRGMTFYTYSFTPNIIRTSIQCQPLVWEMSWSKTYDFNKWCFGNSLWESK